ncbi:bifunctional diaminohydroxyphosphoribosylaminopyrimidine deaminase/5-amino-6-(5-phosphoribosylamino)uracil reductase RibD [Flavobacteriales bacterium]|nr:bifunctional diaminohydroxyphosphoribosylaminopyrimidine deaminase/5-amino-6-(5-phosphoribosylamino)uracil reductase RibD [Flavobacteriales bacterium]MDC3104062.1 bifunctional diaminohydroxyphosphoribosylaminopyrimidine deaminase/5-amino-6-(5-phosphoribosylamino)uracil reductase RibD [Flavobacteriales bacterium]
MDKKYMQVCVDLALKGLPLAFPNPMVGCVIVHNDSIIGQGYHKQYGSHHAEVNAIANVENKELLEQSTLYVSLEPCAHFGKTPPCADLIVKSKIPRVVIGSLDTFSEVNGKGIQRLKEAGIEVLTKVLEKECRAINKRFFTFHEKKRPYIILKWAQTTDGYIAPLNQKEPLWISSLESKTLVHLWRSQEQAILVGRKTVELDNPLLTTREVEGKNPIRIVLDSELSLNKDLHIFNDDASTLVVNDKLSSKNHLKVDFDNLALSLLTELHSRNIQSIIIEGGAQTLNTFIEAKMWDEARVFTSKKLLGKGIKSPLIQSVINQSELIGNDKLTYYINS